LVLNSELKNTVKLVLNLPTSLFQLILTTNTAIFRVMSARFHF